LTHTGFGFLFGVIIQLENYRPTESRNRLLTLKSKLSSDLSGHGAKISPFAEITAKSPIYCLGGQKRAFRLQVQLRSNLKQARFARF